MSPSDPVSTQRFEDYRAHHSREHELLDQATRAAKRAEDLRIDRLNELRQEVERDRGQFQTVVAAELIRQNLEDRLKALELALAGQLSANRTWLIAIGIFFTLLQVALQLFRR